MTRRAASFPPDPYRLAQSALNRFVSLDPLAHEHLDALSGITVVIEVEDVGVCCAAEFTNDGVRLSPRTHGDFDVGVSGTTFNLLRLLNDARGGGDMIGSDVRITGDLEAVQRLRSFAADLDIDWEEHLSRIVGDAGAHGALLAARSFARWGRQAVGTLWRDAGEYLTEEVDLAPSSYDVAAYLDAVDTLRDDVERLRLRIDRLALR